MARKVRIEELGSMLREVASFSEKRLKNKDLAILVSETFSVSCTVEDIENYEELIEMHEDYLQYISDEE